VKILTAEPEVQSTSRFGEAAQRALSEALAWWRWTRAVTAQPLCAMCPVGQFELNVGHGQARGQAAGGDA